jgi:cation diffusion facilitator CzcD-associated flavoprotein CzcO
MAWLAQEMDRHLNPTERKDVVVVGAGFSGMYQLHKLREQGLNVQVFEAGSDVGGTWYWNRYPGARVDIESMAYSFSFSDELQQEWEWSEKYSPQPELLKYAQHIANRFDLKSDIAFDTRVASAHFDEDTNEWLVTTECGRRVRAQHLVMATGVLSASKTPDITGRDNYRGETYRTGLWPKEGVDFTGKRVAVIGTGSSAVQAIPLIAEEAEDVVVYQRTATFTTPALNHALNKDDASVIKANYAEYRAKQRLNVLGVVDERSLERTMDVSAQERDRRFKSGWESGILPGMLFQFADLQVEQEANDAISEYIRDRIRDTVKDEQTAQDLLPTDYPYGTKRPCIDTNYYETFNRENVSLVNLRRTPIETITQKGIRTAEGEREFDAIVYATGFDAMTGPLLRVDIRGRGGVKLTDAWNDGPRSYLGIAIHGFPNLFTITGPSSPSVLSNMLVSIEQHVDWVSDCIQWMKTEGKATIEPSDSAEQEWAEHTEQLANMTLYPKANSWYMGANVPGKPRMFLAYVGGVGTYRMICDQVAAAGYRGFQAA